MSPQKENLYVCAVFCVECTHVTQGKTLINYINLYRGFVGQLSHYFPLMKGSAPRFYELDYNKNFMFHIIHCLQYFAYECTRRFGNCIRLKLSYSKIYYP